MEKLTARKAKIELDMADQSLYEDANADKLAKVRQELAKLESDLAQIETKWMAKQEEYDAMVA